MAILFDLDGTLLDTAPEFIAAALQLRKEFGLPQLPSTALQKIRVSVSHGMSALITAAFEVTETNPTHAIFRKQLLDLYQQNLGQQTKPFPGIEHLLQILDKRKIPWGVVTNKLSYLTEPLLRQQDLAKRAACIVSGDTTPHSKPHPAPLLYAAEVMGISPNRCVYIGDAERDIIAGKTAEMTTIVALFGYVEDLIAAKQWGADHYVYRADEILPWFEQWSHP